MLIGSIFDTAVRGLLHISFYLDMVVYRLAGWAYKVFYVIGRITLDADEAAQAITSKIYTVLLIFMVFVVAYNMLLYIINPDKINDGSVGAGKLVSKIAISLVVIVASPLFFDLLYDVQRDIVEYNVVGTIILGGNQDSSEGDRCNLSGVSASGDALVADVYTSFLYPINGLGADACCDEEALPESDLESDTTIGSYCTAYLDARDKGAIGSFADIADDAIAGDGYQYLGIASTAAGVIMLVYFLSFCVNLGIRLFKLLALELVAPIPALLDLLPGKSGTLSNWFKEVMKVYLQVFIYQAIIFSLVWLATLIPGLLSQVSASIDAQTSGVTLGFELLAKVLMIIALFQACKEVPKMLSEVLGIKGEGGILKAAGLKSIGRFGKGVGMGASFLGGAALSSVGNFAKGVTGAVREDGIKGVGRGVASGLRGAAGGLARNAWGARNAKSFSDLRNARKTADQKVEARRSNREAYRRNHGGTFGGVVAGRVGDFKEKAIEKGQGFLGIQDNFDRISQSINQTVDHLKGAKIDDRSGRLGELNQQKDRLQTELSGFQNSGKQLADQIKSLEDEKKRRRGHLSAAQEQTLSSYKSQYDEIQRQITVTESTLNAVNKEFDEEKFKKIEKNEPNMQQAAAQFFNDVAVNNNEYLESALKNVEVDYDDGLGKRKIEDARKELEKFFNTNGTTREGADLKQAQTLLDEITKSVSKQQNAINLEKINRENRKINQGGNDNKKGS